MNIEENVMDYIFFHNHFLIVTWLS